jgi:hypothetical protein
MYVVQILARFPSIKWKAGLQMTMKTVCVCVCVCVYPSSHHLKGFSCFYKKVRWNFMLTKVTLTPYLFMPYSH